MLTSCTPAPEPEPHARAAPLLGDDGNATISTTTTVNRYQALRNDVAAGATQIRVPDVAAFNVQVGDLLLVMQMQGATIDTTDPNSPTWGQVTDLGNAGVYELVTITSFVAASNTRINIQGACGGGLRNSYTIAAHTQVIFVPQYRTLTIDQNGQITAPAWDGATGGVVALQAERLVVGGAATGAINVNALGFRGGVRNQHADFRNQTAYAGDADVGGEKGEGVAGYQDDYNGGLHRYGRGAAANAGGGGNAHNCGGGGGANASNGVAYTGSGVKDVSTANNVTAWNLEAPAPTDSSGGGRGGYSFASVNRDELTEGPADPDWGGDLRRNNGGRGGRPLTANADSRIFLGGGGGAGDVNNGSTPTNGGRGGGIALILADRVERHTSGSFLITANGENGGDAAGGANQGNDGPGGAGAGGTIVLRSGSVAQVALVANGGRGGLQNINGYADESEGPGGGGGGGFIAVSTGSATTSVLGGAGGTSNSPAITNFTLNGATGGAPGATTTAIPYARANIPACFDADLAVAITPVNGSVNAGANVVYTVTYTNNGANRVNGAVASGTFDSDLGAVAWTCVGGGCPAASGSGFSNVTLGAIDPAGTVVFTLTIPVSGGATGTIDTSVSVAAPSIITDGTPGNNTAISSLTVVNPAPVNTVPGTVTTNVNTPLVFTAPQLGVTDPDSANVTTTLTVTSGTITVAGAGGTVTGSGTGTVVISGTLAQVNARLDAITFTPANNSTAAVTMQMVSSDGTSSDTDSFTIEVNSPPVNTLPATGSTPLNQPLVFGAAPLDVTDVDSPNMTTTLTVTSGTITVGGAGGTVTGSGTANVSISGTLAQVQARLDNITFTPANGSTTAVTLTMVSNDGAATDTDTMTISIQSPPTNTLTGPFAVTEDTPFLFGGPVLGVADPDSANVTTTISVPVGSGTFTVGTCAATVTGAGSNSIAFAGTLAQVNACLDALTYTPPLNSTTSVTLTMVSTDGAANDTDTATIVIAPVNDPPINQLPFTVAASEDTPFLFNPAVIGVSDVDSANITTTLTVSGGTLTIGGAGGTVTGSGTASVVISGTVAQVNARLDAVTFTPASDSTTNVTLSMVSSDGQATDIDPCLITIAPVNDPPTVIVAPAMSATEDTPRAFGGGELVVNDVDSATVTAVLSVSSGTLTVGGAGGTVTGNNTASVTISGTIAEVNSRLGATTFNPAANSTTPVTVTLNATDPSGGTATASGTITITPVNDGPVNQLPPTVTVAEDTAFPFPAGNIGVTDPDGPTLTTTISVPVGGGTFAVGGAGGTVTGSGTRSVTISGTVAQVNARLDALTFTPAPDSTTSVTITMSSSDGTESDIDTCVVTITAQNDPPTAILPPTRTTAEDTPLSFAGSVSVNDIDSPTLTVTLSVPSGATLAVVGTGGTVTGNGTNNLQINGTIAEVNARLGSLTFTPALNATGPVTLTMVTSDGTASVNNNCIITITPLNDPPVNQLPATATTLINQPLAFPAANIGVTDVDSANVTTTLTVTSGTLGVGGSGGTVTGNNSANVVISGTLAQVNARLDTLTFTPANASTLPVTLTMTSTDGTATDIDLCAITVSGSPPVNTLPATASGTEDTALPIAGVSVTDPDVGQQLTTVVSIPGGSTITVTAGGGATITGNGTGSVTIAGTQTQVNAALAGLTVTPAANVNGTLTLTMVTTDATNASDTDTSQLTFAPANDNPTANNDTANATKNSLTGVLVNVTSNDSSAPDTGETLTVTAAGPAPNGTVTIEGNSVRYVPNPGFSGPDTFSYTISDGNGGTATATVTVTVGATNPNQPPVVTVPATQTVAEDVPLSFGSTNRVAVSDPDSGSAQVEMTIGVENGSFTLSTTTGLTFLDGDGSNDVTTTVRGTIAQLAAALDGATFQGAANFFGTARVTIAVDDLGNTGTGGALRDSESFEITVTPVNDNPTAVNDVVTVPGGATPAATTIDVRANDSSLPDGPETLTIESVTMPTHGMVAIVAGEVVYTPNADYVGPDSFTYTIADGNGGTATATVTLTVVAAGVNIGPTNTLPATATTDEDVALALPLAVSDPDAATAPLRVTLTVTNGTLTLGTTTGLTFVAGDGTDDTTLTITGAQAELTAALQTLVFAPTANFNGTAMLFMTTSDQGNTGTGGEKLDVDSLEITVTSVNDAPTANDDNASAKAGGSTIPLDVLANDSAQPDTGEVLTIVSVTQPSSGSVAINGSELLFTPGAEGTVTFTYTIDDGHGGTDTATVTINVGPATANNPPVNNLPMTQTVAEDVPLVFSTNTSNNVTVSDIDAGNTPITVTLVATNGTLTPGPTTTGVTVDGTGTGTLTLTGTVTAINTALEQLTFTPTANYNGPATITVTSNDNGATGTGGPQTDVDPIAITVTPVNDDPTATPDTVTTTGVATIDVLANDSGEPDTGETLTIIAVTQPMHGTAAIVDGKIVYTPTAGYVGPDSFTYTISDGMGGEATATVSISVVDPTLDTDGDGIPDVIEEMTGTDPFDDDTDDDGLLDGIEDTDHDGMNDPGDSDPRKADTDGDGLQDGTELGLTEPQGDDTDPDVFIPDADPSTMTDPLDKDTDNGSVEDGVEDANHNGRIDDGERDPNNPLDDVAGDPDTDGDGIPDRVENGAGSCLSATDADSDNDGLSDGAEDKDHDGVVDVGETDPCNPDSDGGGVPDGKEVEDGSDPLKPGDDRVFAVAGGGVGGCSTASSPIESLASLLLLGAAFVVLSVRRRVRF